MAVVNSFGDVVIAYDDQALALLLAGPSGPVALQLAQIGVRLESQMKINVTGGGPSGMGPHVQTGRLRASITWQVDADQGGLLVDAGTNVPYGRYLEEGTDRMRPHPWAQPALDSVVAAGL
jgi:hypothetical protein